jgi:PAS domain S-box-containing protein
MDASDYREEVYDVFSRSEVDVTTRVREALRVGERYLGVPIGFLTRIEGGTQEIVTATGDHDLIRAGERCPLDEAYCRRTVEMTGTLAVQDADASTSVADAAVRTFGLGAYIGAKVTVDDAVYGTVCFAQHEARGADFTEAEETFVELLARLVGRALERRDYRRRLERRNERLEREKRRFEGIAENSSDVIFRIDAEGRFTYVSSAVKRILGYAPADLVGDGFVGAVDATSVDDARDAFRSVLDGETVQNVELGFESAAGDRVTIEVNATPIREDGAVVGVQGVGRDVTARKERERELRMKTRAIDEARLGISIAELRDGEAPLVYANGGFERLTGYDAADAVGRDCRFLQGEATDDDAVARLREGIAAREPVSVELINYRADGTPFWNQLRLSPVAEEDGRVTRFLGFQTDVTERKRSEQLIRLLNRVLRHNLRNDMNVLLGIGAELGRTGTSSLDEPGERIERTAGALVDLSEQARRLERVARQERDPERLDPGELFERVAAGIGDRVPAATVDVDVDADRGVCAGAELKEAVTELAENAVTHNPATEPWVELAATDDGDWVELTVTDDGPGVDDMETAVIATGEETDLAHGSGLGLWLVNWIVTRYGGSFQIRGDDDGSVATLRLPAIDADTPVADVERGPTVLFR